MNKQFKYIQQEDVFFILLLVFAFIQSLSTYRHVGLSDDGAYIYAAHDLCLGHIPVTENFYANRIGTVAPFAFAMKVLGWYGPQLTYVSTCLFLLLLVFVYAIVSRFNKVIALFSASFLGISKIVLTSSAVVMGDITITLLANAPVLIYFWLMASRNRGIRYPPLLFGLIAGMLFVMAVLTKESVVFYLPLLCWLAYYDRKGGKRPFWIALFSVIIVAGFLICSWYLWVNGDFFYRVHAVSLTCSQSECNYAGAPWWLILKRITFQPMQFLVEDYAFGLLTLLSLINLCRKSPSEEIHFFKICLVFTIGMWWFGPQGLPWNPVALTHRVWLPLMVPLAINASVILFDIISGNLPDAEKNKSSHIVIIFLAATAFFLYQLQQLYAMVNEPQYFLPMGVWYAIISIALIAALLLKNEIIPYYLPDPKKILFPLIVLSLVGSQGLATTLIFATNAFKGASSLSWNDIDPDYNRERDIILYTEALNPPLIVTDYARAEKYHVFDNFARNYPFKAWANVPIDSVPKGACLLMRKSDVESRGRFVPETRIYTHTNDTIIIDAIPDYVYHPGKYGFVLLKNTSLHEVWKKE